MAAAEIKLRVPAPSSMLVINVLGVVGLLAVAVAVGGLTHTWWWSLLVGGAFAVALAVIAMTWETRAAAEQDAATGGGPAAAPVSPLSRPA